MAQRLNSRGQGAEGKGKKHRVKSTEHRARGKKLRAQSTERRAEKVGSWQSK